MKKTILITALLLISLVTATETNANLDYRCYRTKKGSATVSYNKRSDIKMCEKRTVSKLETDLVRSGGHIGCGDGDALVPVGYAGGKELGWYGNVAKGNFYFVNYLHQVDFKNGCNTNMQKNLQIPNTSSGMNNTTGTYYASYQYIPPCPLSTWNEKIDDYRDQVSDYYQKISELEWWNSKGKTISDMIFDYVTSSYHQAEIMRLGVPASAFSDTTRVQNYLKQDSYKLLACEQYLATQNPWTGTNNYNAPRAKICEKVNQVNNYRSQIKDLETKISTMSHLLNSYGTYNERTICGNDIYVNSIYTANWQGLVSVANLSNTSEINSTLDAREGYASNHIVIGDMTVTFGKVLCMKTNAVSSYNYTPVNHSFTKEETRTSLKVKTDFTCP